MSSRNVTIDDLNNSTLISYHPALCNGSAWSVNDQRGYSGTYRYCTSSDALSANISFTGVAVYYVSPNFEGSSIRFRLDGVLSENINLSTPPGDAVNRSRTRIIWSQTELENKLHSLELHPGTNVTTLNVDAFIITQADTMNTNSTSPIATAAAAAGVPAQSPGTTRLGIAFGVTFGSIAFLIFMGIAVFLAKRTRALNRRYSWTKPVPQLSANDQYLNNTDTRAFTQDSHDPSRRSLTMGEPEFVMRPLPVPAHGSFTTRGDFEHEDDSPRWTSKSPAPSHAPSNSHLLYGPSSSHGHGDVVSVSRGATFTSSRLEPVRKGTNPGY
ncbi:hypothetical protein M413DRAFT_197132 [Hebeloma cylindrosporum]|uniref:Uncharacterized protein n=1 Tax=Hebeloma cylindrosporum TaxID=76867 RepID=A0A0C2XNR7_HEBCY|nr:hypothetical protein M413DRAFT_197132 [Hebeloma cylindrosporum h7]